MDPPLPYLGLTIYKSGTLDQPISAQPSASHLTFKLVYFTIQEP